MTDPALHQAVASAADPLVSPEHGIIGAIVVALNVAISELRLYLRKRKRGDTLQEEVQREVQRIFERRAAQEARAEALAEVEAENLAKGVQNINTQLEKLTRETRMYHAGVWRILNHIAPDMAGELPVPGEAA